MLINNIKLDSFRNYKSLYTEFSDKVNIIIGDNAQGKTNLLEAIFYLTSGRSFKARSDKEVLNFDSEFASICANIFTENRDQNIEIKFEKGRRKQLFVNGIRLKTAAELSGKLTAVLFCPDDLYIIKDGAFARRRMMDLCIAQMRPRYAAILSEYARVYEHKTRILRDYHNKPSLLETFDEFSYQMARLSAELIYYRAAFVKLLSASAAAIHNEFSGNAEKLDIYYRTVKTIDDPAKPPRLLLPIILEHQAVHKKAEIDSGMCLTGAHKDDLEILINGFPAKSFASQGQTRTAALSLKLAERELLYNDSGEYPILLLDDVLSELDPGRQNFILNKIGSGQIFITCCEDGQIAEKTGGKVLRIKEGEII